MAFGRKQVRLLGRSKGIVQVMVVGRLQAQVALYAAAEDEGALLEYLGAARDPLGAPLYEPQFALRVARQDGHLKACVQLLCELNLYEARIMLP